MNALCGPFRGAVTLLLVAVLVTAGCSDDGAGEAEEATTTSTADVELTSYDDIASLHDRLVAENVACGLEYEGLEDDGKEVSLCVIEGEQALLTIWGDPNLVEEFAGSDAAQGGTVAIGANWTVDLDTAATAAMVAEALGGTVSGS